MFLKKCKNISTKQEIVSDAAFKTWPFSSDFNFACKDGRVTAATYNYYCSLVVNPTITNCCKEFHLKWHSSYIRLWKRCHHTRKLLQFHVKTSCFSLFRNVPTFIKSQYLCYFLQYDEVFLISFLDCCYHYLVVMDQSMVVQSQNNL